MSEFPEGADAPPDLSRRELLRLLGASAALAGASGCSRGAAEYIVPYVVQPPEVTPGVPALYATTMQIDGYGTGVIAECHEGRPTKVEGNPEHPASAGALGTFGQASILSLYDPARAQALTHRGTPATWRQFVQAVSAPRGKPIHVVLEPTSSPHVVDLVERARMRGDVVVHYDAPLARDAAWRGATMAFGRVLEPNWNLARAEIVVSLDADFLAATTTPTAWTRAWARTRVLDGPNDRISRLYVVEPRLTVTGMSADERIAVRPSEVRAVAASLLRELVAGAGPVVATSAARGVPRGPYDSWVRAVARDLRAHAGAALVMAGDGQPAEVHAFAHAMNELLGGVGRVVTFGASPVHDAGAGSHDLAALTAAIDAGDVGALVFVGGDPAYSSPSDRRLGERIGRVPVTAYVGFYRNATARLCEWFVPQAHFLESWADARAFDGTPSIAQPVIRPRFDVTTPGEVLAALMGLGDASPRELVQTAWRSLLAAGDFDGAWTRTLARGALEGGRFPTVSPALDWASVARELGAPRGAAAPMEVVYFGDAKVHDGRFSNNAWLQELADPITKLTWDNAALVSPATAARLDLVNEGVVELQVRERTVRAPVLVVPGTADDVVAIAVGYGQTDPDLLAGGVGANAYAVRDSRAPWFDAVDVRRTGATWQLALTQEHGSMEGRPIVLTSTLDEYRRDPSFARRRNQNLLSLYDAWPQGAQQWGMTIDLNTCTGCSACVVACMAENNIPVVGKGGVRLGRAMHWIRLDRYFMEGREGPAAAVQPMLCQQCEKAPCEYVCPVNATVHSADGLNEMVYNRCVGTRFCSNNCPYKVRRFNFFNYNIDKADSLRLAMNPDVTVRARGVMEKCTYCVQRIRETEIRARREQRAIRDLEVVTACQQTCPTGAIVFGNIADPASRVSTTRHNARMYQVLEELGTLPRTRYLARITNPNPDGQSS